MDKAHHMHQSDHMNMAHGEHHRQMILDFKKRFWFSLILNSVVRTTLPLNFYG